MSEKKQSEYNECKKAVAEKDCDGEKKVKLTMY
jgi:hypothetical protein